MYSLFVFSIIIALLIHVCKLSYKVAYYESKLQGVGVDVSHVKNKSLLSMLLD